MISLMPMAGGGSRFAANGYNLPKPFIPIMGKPMFVAATKSCPPASTTIFICQERFLSRYPFEQEVAKHFENYKIYSVSEITEGQASSCLIAADSLDTDESLVISSIDYQLVYDEAKLEQLLADESVDVVIFTLQIKSMPVKDLNGFAYCRLEGDRVVEIVEKRTISNTPREDQAVSGSFYYRRSRDFVRSARQMIEKNIRVNNEFYVGTSINQLIEQGANVRYFPLDKFISFGNPFELELYHFWEDYFYSEPGHDYAGLKG